MLGVLLQFPSPYRAPSTASGNSQLPSAADDESYMVTPPLVQAIRAALQPTGWLLLQSNVEDVALHARAVAEAEGLRAVAEPLSAAACRGVVLPDGQSARLPSHASPLQRKGPSPPLGASTPPGERRRARLEQALGGELPRAQGSGWWEVNQLQALGRRALTETEAMAELQGRVVYRCLLAREPS